MRRSAGGRKPDHRARERARQRRSRDEPLIRALVNASRWRRRIESGQARSITDLAEQQGVTDVYFCRLLPLT
jgi:hypothetical protein